jgi:hypothetical protein
MSMSSKHGASFIFPMGACLLMSSTKLSTDLLL